VFLANREDDHQEHLEANRRSFLATPLFLEADFWINLPVYTDHPTLGVNGALVNATLWNASNTARFMKSPDNAPAAVAEMSAIPELRQTWLFTIASLQQYQFIGGPAYNSLYTVSDKDIWLSADPVALDTLMLERINKHRSRWGFPIISEEIRTLEFAEVLKVGSASNLDERLVRVDG
jgi:GAF domain-containing protein